MKQYITCRSKSRSRIMHHIQCYTLLIPPTHPTHAHPRHTQKRAISRYLIPCVTDVPDHDLFLPRSVFTHSTQSLPELTLKPATTATRFIDPCFLPLPAQLCLGACASFLLPLISAFTAANSCTAKYQAFMKQPGGSDKIPRCLPAPPHNRSRTVPPTTTTTTHRHCCTCCCLYNYYYYYCYNSYACASPELHACVIATTTEPLHPKALRTKTLCFKSAY